MYLSKLTLNPRHPLARRDLGNPYEMHGTLSWMFEDPKAARVLWRLESERPPVVLVQSLVRPDSSRVEARDGFTGYFAQLPETKPYELVQHLREGQILRFCLEANPTVTRGGRRHGLRRVEDQLWWLHRQAEKAGVFLLGATVSRTERRSFRKRGQEQGIVLWTARFDGILQVRDPQRLCAAIQQGIGHGKALGLGLLSVAPIR